MSTERTVSTEILSGAFNALGRNLHRYLLLGFVVPIPLLVLLAGVLPRGTQHHTQGPGMERTGIYFADEAALFLFAAVAALAWVFWLSRLTALVLTIRRDAGARVSVYRAFRQAMSRLVPLMMLQSFRAVLGAMGLCFFVLPGVLFLQATALAEAAVVAQGLEPVAALRRSLALQKKWGWAHLLGARALLGLLLLFYGFVAFMFAHEAGVSWQAALAAMGALLVLLPLNTIVLGIAYRRLSTRGE